MSTKSCSIPGWTVGAVGGATVGGLLGYWIARRFCEESEAFLALERSCTVMLDRRVTIPTLIGLTIGAIAGVKVVCPSVPILPKW
jgi:hypothetical protein